MLPAGAAAVHPLSLLCPRWKIRRTDFPKKEGPLHGIGSVRVAPAPHRLWGAVFPLQTGQKGSPRTGSENPPHSTGTEKLSSASGRKADPPHLMRFFAQKKRAGTRPVLFLVILKNYSSILETTPEPTVRPPSRIAKRRPCSMAIGVISSTLMVTLSPGMHISTPSGREITPVTSVVRK